MILENIFYVSRKSKAAECIVALVYVYTQELTRSKFYSMNEVLYSRRPTTITLSRYHLDHETQNLLSSYSSEGEMTHTASLSHQDLTLD